MITEPEAESEASKFLQLIEVRPTLPDGPPEISADNSVENPVDDGPPATSRDSAQKPLQAIPDVGKQDGVEVPLAADQETQPKLVSEEASSAQSASVPPEPVQIDVTHPARNQRNPDPAAKDQRPISKAERRKMIKQEIHRLSHLDEPMMYQRRLW